MAASCTNLMIQKDLSINNSALGKAYMTVEDPNHKRDSNDPQRYEDILVPLGSVMIDENKHRTIVDEHFNTSYLQNSHNPQQHLLQK